MMVWQGRGTLFFPHREKNDHNTLPMDLSRDFSLSPHGVYDEADSPPEPACPTRVSSSPGHSDEFVDKALSYISVARTNPGTLTDALCKKVLFFYYVC